MKFFRNNWFWILGILIGVGISSIILGQRNQPQTDETGNMAPDLFTQTESSEVLSPENGSQRSYKRNNMNKPVTMKRTPRIRAKASDMTSRDIPHLLHHPHKERVPDLPKDIQKRLDALYTGLPEVDAHLDEKRLEILAGDKDIESTVQFLEKHEYYNSAILKLLDTARAFQYLKSLPAHQNEATEYAKRILIENPNNLEARMQLARREKDAEVGAAAYRAILKVDPNFVPAMNGLGSRLHYNHPKEAIRILKQMKQLDPTRGDFSLGLSYERLGDYKTAWVHYRKALIQDPDGQLIYMRMEHIADGKPIYSSIQWNTQTSASLKEENEQTPSPQGSDTDATVSKTESSEISLWNNELIPVDPLKAEVQYNQDAADAKQAYQELRKLGFQDPNEFQQFLNWLERVENDPSHSQDFLSQQMKLHLTGGNTPEFNPERIIRAFEIMERYGPKEGIKRLEKNDPEVAKQVKRLLAEELPPQHVKER